MNPRKRTFAQFKWSERYHFGSLIACRGCYRNDCGFLGSKGSKNGLNRVQIFPHMPNRRNFDARKTSILFVELIEHVEFAQQVEAGAKRLLPRTGRIDFAVLRYAEKCSNVEVERKGVVPKGRMVPSVAVYSPTARKATTQTATTSGRLWVNQGRLAARVNCSAQKARSEQTERSSAVNAWRCRLPARRVGEGRLVSS